MTAQWWRLGKSVAAAAAAAASALEAAAEAAVTPGTRVAVEAPAPRRRTRPLPRASPKRAEKVKSPRRRLRGGGRQRSFAALPN